MRFAAAVLLAFPAAALAQSPEPVVAGRESDLRTGGHTIVETERGSLAIVNRGQFRYTLERPDDDVQLLGTSEAGDDKGAFRIRRAKTELRGWVWTKTLTYELQLSWAGPEPGASTQSPLEDAVVTWDVKGDGRLRVSGGQFKVPLGRQEMTSSSYLQLVERDILSGEFTRGRDLGLQVDGRLARGRLEYAAGIFNGNPASRGGNDNVAYQYNARLVFEPFGPLRYTESDFESRARRRPLVALGVQAEHNDLHGSGTRVNDYRTTIVGGEVVVKHRGLSAFFEYFGRQRDPETGASFRSDGWHAQAGYFVLRDRLEGAFRYARYDPSPTPGDDVSETGGGISWYVRRHALKVQGDLRRLENENVDTVTHEVRVQTQVIF